MKIARLFYVSSKRGRVLHLSKHITEGYRTLCGIAIPAPGRWLWRKVRPRKAAVCKKCQRHAPQIVVQRVRR